MTDNINGVRGKTWVDNVKANDAVIKAKECIERGDMNAGAVQYMMDLIISVERYNINDTNRQGVIGKLFNKEKFRGHNGMPISNHFGYDMHDVISIFWEEVFRSLPNAKIQGDIVSVRQVDGQDGIICDYINGVTYTKRKTDCNPIHFLRNRGIMAVRNALNESYRHNIRQVCDSCGSVSTKTTLERESQRCPQCKSLDTEKYWPDGNSSYLSKKWRKCNTCKHQWLRKFTHMCHKCGSDSVYTDMRVVAHDDSILQLASMSMPADQLMADTESTIFVKNLTTSLRQFLPSDPSNTGGSTKTIDVFDILTDPAASLNMCKMCRHNAPLICQEQCRDFSIHGECGHTLIPDPSVCCGSEYFNDKCINYSKKIGEYHKCSASLTSRRVKKVREYVKRFIVLHRNDSCAEMYELLSKYGL